MDAPNLLRLVFGDAHRIAGKVEDCDTAKVERFVGVAIERQAAEVIGNGDNADTTRDRDAVETAGEYFGRVMGRPFARAGIPVVFGAGNHDPWGHLAGGRFLRALIQSGFDPQLVSLASGPIQRGRWVIGHGHPLDPSCCGGPLTKVGEVATRVDHVLDQVGVDIEGLNPATFRPGPGEDAFLDHPVHRRAFRLARGGGLYWVISHTHLAGDAGGDYPRAWRVLNPGALTKTTSPGCYVWFTDDGQGGVEPL